MSRKYTLSVWSLAAAAILAIGTPVLAQADNRVEIEYGRWSPLEQFVIRYAQGGRYYAPPRHHGHGHHEYHGDHHRHRHHRRHDERHASRGHHYGHALGGLRQQFRDLYRRELRHDDRAAHERRHRDSDRPRSERGERSRLAYEDEHRGRRH